jgi:hypothetical protein
MSTPDRHSTRAVQRYALYFDTVSANWPNPIVVDPAPLTADTFACRFRDAVAGVISWNSAPHLLESVSRWSSDYVVASIKGTGKLMIGSRQLVKERLAPSATVGLVIDANLAPIDTVEAPSKKVLSALITLMEFYVLEHVTLRKIGLPEIEEALQGCTRPIEVMENNEVYTLI